MVHLIYRHSTCVRTLRFVIRHARIFIAFIGITCAGWDCLWAPAYAAEARKTHLTFTAPVRVVGKRFMQGDSEIIINGLNYFPAYFPSIMPSSWLDARHYRPEIVEDELTTIQNLGVNLVSIQGLTARVIPSTQDCTNLHDFLDRAQSHGMLVNLYIGTGSLMPIADPSRLAIVPKVCALSGHPDLFAYDIALEPHFGRESVRRALQPQWLKWLEAAYGSLAIADAAFRGNHALPTDKELCGEAPNIKVAAFRRFLDDMLSASYRDARAAILAVDSTHLIGARSGYGGNGSAWICPEAPVDLRAGAKHLDFVSPEAYSLPQTDRIGLLNRGGFTASYADIGKPIFWAEYGINVDGSCANCTETVQANFFSNMFELIRKTASNGGAAWWFVGVRPQSPADGEKSDYGIIYDYMKFATSRDAFGDPLRDGLLAVCVANPTDYGLHNAHDTNFGMTSACPAGWKPDGSFRDEAESQATVKRATHDRRSGDSRWLTLCGANDSALLAVTYDDKKKEGFECPGGYSSAGSFKPAPVNAETAAIDAVGRSIRSGWLTLCTRKNSTLLKRVHNEMSGRNMSCPLGLTNIGSFKPQSLPIFRPAARLLNGALLGVSAAHRIYATFITVDRDAAAGDWKMYETGTKAYAISASGGQHVGVRTSCTGSTSDEMMCVGNTPYNGSCPAKCLNAEWSSVQVLDAGGTWQTVADRGNVTVSARSPIHARLVVGNTGEAKWLTVASAGGGKGSVRFGCNENVGDMGCRHNIAADSEMFEDVSSGDFVISNGVTKKTRVVFQMVSENIAWFGERVAVALLPR